MGDSIQRAAVAYNINAYLYKDRDTTKQQAFDQAKSELTNDLQKDIELIKTITLASFLEFEKKGFRGYGLYEVSKLENKGDK